MKLICRNNFQQQRRPKCGMQWSFEEVTCKWAADRSVGVGDAEGCGDDELCTASGRSSGHGETDWGWDGPLSSVTSWSSPPGQLPPSQAAEAHYCTTNRDEKIGQMFQKHRSVMWWIFFQLQILSGKQLVQSGNQTSLGLVPVKNGSKTFNSVWPKLPCAWQIQWFLLYFFSIRIKDS